MQLFFSLLIPLLLPEEQPFRKETIARMLEKDCALCLKLEYSKNHFRFLASLLITHLPDETQCSHLSFIIIINHANILIVLKKILIKQL